MSLKGDKYETLEEVKARLEGTVVLYEGKPVYITNVIEPEAAERKEISRVLFSSLPLPNLRKPLRDLAVAGQRKYLSSRNFDLTPFKMGYFNYDNKAIFVSRIPARQYKQGLSTATTSLTDVRGRATDVTFSAMLQSQGFLDMVEGKYPSFKEAGELLGNEETSSIAISRSFAFLIDHDLESLVLMNKGVKCGLVQKGDKGLRVPPKFHFLRQEMEENRIPLV